jgi:1,2-diacylglycerol 3-alpha-glucosyltransferase
MSCKVAVLFDNFGPYHVARLRAAAQRTDLLAVEFASRSGEYAWEASSTNGEPFRRVTLLSTTSRDGSSSKFCEVLDAHLSSFRPDAVAIPGWSSGRVFSALNWCLQTRTPAIVMSASSAHDETRKRWKEWIKRHYVRLCSAALAGGRMHFEYLGALGLARDRIFLGYDAVDNDYLATETAKIKRQKSEARMKFGLPADFFLASARFIEKKNLPRLIQAYALYKNLALSDEQRGRSRVWDLVLLGDGPLRPALCSKLRALGLQNAVHLPGFVQYEQLPVYYGLAETFIHASTTEQWGLVVNEAMASRLPVLVSNRCGCVPELVAEGVNGFTFDPNNIVSMAHLMMRMANTDSETRRGMGRASYRIISSWGPDRFARGLQEAVECAIRSGPPCARLLDRVLLKALMLWQASSQIPKCAV